MASKGHPTFNFPEHISTIIRKTSRGQGCHLVTTRLSLSDSSPCSSSRMDDSQQRRGRWEQGQQVVGSERHSPPRPPCRALLADLFWVGGGLGARRWRRPELSWGRRQPLLLPSALTLGLPPIAFTLGSPHYPQGLALSAPCPPPQPHGRGPVVGSPDPSCPQLLSTSVPWKQWGSRPARASPTSTLGRWAASCFLQPPPGYPVHLYTAAASEVHTACCPKGKGLASPMPTCCCGCLQRWRWEMATREPRRGTKESKTGRPKPGSCEWPLSGAHGARRVSGVRGQSPNYHKVSVSRGAGRMSTGAQDRRCHPALLPCGRKTPRSKGMPWTWVWNPD